MKLDRLQVANVKLRRLPQALVEDDGDPVSSRRDFAANRRVLVIIAMAILASICTSVVGVLMFRLIELITNLLYFGRFSFTYIPFAESPLGWLAVLVPIGGSIIVGFMARYGTDKIRGHGLPEAIEAILLD
ncbi:MAG: hypothetical protein ACREF3_13180, partial [Acetobacteraceae bacterium]